MIDVLAVACGEVTTLKALRPLHITMYSELATPDPIIMYTGLN